MAKNKVSTLAELQNRSEELKREGFVAVRPGRYAEQGGARTLSWGNYIKSQLMSASTSTDGKAARQQISTVFTSGGEATTPREVGSPDLGFMEWGQGNRLPNIVWMLTKLSPFTAAGWDFIKKIIAGRGPVPKYHYTQYVGGNITDKYIPYANAGTLLRGQLADARKQENPDKELIASLEADLKKWQETMYGGSDGTKNVGSLQSFLDDNDLMQTFLTLSGDMALVSQCFVELQLNQRQVNENGQAVPTAQWTPKVIGIKPRSVFTTRLERMDDNYRINNVYFSNQWLDSSQQTGAMKEEDLRISAIPFLPSNSALKDLRRHVREARQSRVSRKDRPTRFCMSPRDFGGPYYADTTWHSIFAGSIYEFAFTIIDDRLTRKQNSNIIGRVIYIHQDYLNALFRQQGESDKKKTMAQLQSEVFEDINTWLSNPDNAGQALISSVFTGPDGKEHKAWEIVEIETKANDQAQAQKTELQEISSIIFFAMGLDSKLIGNTPGDSSFGGGTDLRERFLVKQIQFAPLQQIMLHPLEVISDFNEWDEHLEWQIDREVLTTLDNSKTGVTNQPKA